MTWQQLTCQSTAEHQEAISELLESAGAASVTFQDAADQPVLEPLPGETPLWDQLIITGLFPLEADLTELLLILELRKSDWKLSNIKVEPLEDRPWVREWMDNFQPMSFGKRLWIYPSWAEAPDDASVKILLDPGLAFGTGNHPTTALCLEWLDGQDLSGKTVLDYGCGSGILTIAAAKLGATNIMATDIDPQALDATRENCLRNEIAVDKVTTLLPEDVPVGTYDIVIANILAGPLVTLAPTLLSHLKPGGQLALSGILNEQRGMIEATYAPALSNYAIDIREDWIRLAGTGTAQQELPSPAYP